MWAESTTFVLVGLLVFLLITYSWRRPHNLPPGPRGLPIVGALPRLGRKPYLTIQRWWEMYGDVYSMYLGSQLVVVINGVEAMRECLLKQGDVFSARPWNYFKKLTNNKGLVFTDGEVWKEHRRFTLTCLRDFGMGKVNLEEKVHEELGYLMGEMLKEEERPFPAAKHVSKAVSNIICSIIYGTRFDYADEEFRANIKALDQSVRHQSLLAMIQFLPFLEFLPKILTKDKLMLKNFRRRESYANYQLQSHKESLDTNNPRDFIDAYIIRMNELNAKQEETTFHESQLLRTIQDLFIAGSETLNTTLKWAFLFMAVHPEVQKRVQQEIDAHIGTSRWPSMRDRTRLPYTDATLMECQRLGNIALFSVPRCASRTTTVNGYTVPEGAWVFINRWGTHASSRYWKRPKLFDPTRFLDSHGKVYKPEAFIPFGMGPRSCIGESLAKMELFIFFVATLQLFTLSLPCGCPTPSLEPQAGINMSPQPYLLVATQR